MTVTQGTCHSHPQHIPTLKRVKEELCQVYKMHDLGPIKYILGIEVIRDRPNRTMYLSQRKHVGDVLERFQMTDT
jgi:hypothetical protein